MTDPHFQVERLGHVAVFRITRPSQSNAMTREVLLGLGQTARFASSERDVRALIVTSSGDKVFCAGADLKERAGWSENDVRVQLGLYQSELGALDACTKPVVAALNGHALGGGLEIALACDLRVSVPHATFGLPETGIGIIPGAGGTQRLPRLIGEGRAKEMILLGRRIAAQQALAFGLVNRICPDGADLLDDTIAWIEPIVLGAPLAQTAALAAVDATRELSLEQGLNFERLQYDEVLRSADRLEGIRAFQEKRRPSFHGD